MPDFARKLGLLWLGCGSGGFYGPRMLRMQRRRNQEQTKYKDVRELSVDHSVHTFKIIKRGAQFGGLF
jgi:hypothetical protein